MGLMREARRAGRYPATKATAHSRAVMPANVTGSVGVVPKSSDAIAAPQQETQPYLWRYQSVSAASSGEHAQQHMPLRRAEGHADADFLSAAGLPSKR